MADTNQLSDNVDGMDTGVKLRVAEGLLSLRRMGPEEWKWVPVLSNAERPLQQIAELATHMSNPPHYRYSPADGQPGYRLAQMLAQEMNGKAIVPELQDSPASRNVVY